MTYTLPVIKTDLDSLLETKIPPGSVLCCLTDSASLEQQFPHPKSSDILSIDECKRLNSITHTAAKKRFFLGRSFIRHVLAFYLNRSAKDIIFEYNAYGKPFQQHDTKLSFNLSHTANKFALAISFTGDIGIDIERHKSRRNILDIADEVLTTDEQQWFRKLTNQEQVIQFYRLWSLKEATLKAQGSGLYIPMQSFGFKKGLLVAEWNSLLGATNLWRWSHFSEKSFSVAIALKTSEY